jgi:MFS family permease
VARPLDQAPPYRQEAEPHRASDLGNDRSATHPKRWLTTSNTILLIICLMYLILYVDRVNISTAAPLIKADLALSNTQLGLAFSAFAYPYALFQLIGGYFGDKFGPRLTLCVCSLIVCVATAATGAVGGFASLFAARLALGIGEGATFPTATRAMSVWTPERNWGFAQGITHSSARIGNAMTPPLVAVLIAYLSWRGSFIVLALLSLVWVLVWMWYFRDVPAAPPLSTEELAALPARSRRGAKEPVPWLKLFRRMLPVTAVDFCYGWTLWLFLSWVPSFFYQNYHQNLMQSALYSATVFLAGVIGDTLGGVVSDRILHRTGDRNAARRNVIVAGLLGGFLFLMPVMLVDNVNVAAISLAAAFFCVELVVAPIWAVPMDIAPKYSGSASGMMNFGFGVAGIISPFVFGYLIDRTGSWTLPFAGSIGLLLLGAGLAFLMRPDRPFELATSAPSAT